MPIKQGRNQRNQTIFFPGRYYPFWALPKKSYIVSNLPYNEPRTPSPRSTLVHTNYTTARTKIEVPFCTGCAGITERTK